MIPSVNTLLAQVALNGAAASPFNAVRVSSSVCSGVGCWVQCAC